MKRINILVFSLVLGICGIAAVAGESQQIMGVLKWDELPRLPVLMGIAGPFSGVSNGALIVAGGTSFSAPLCEDGEKNPAVEKVWYDKVYVLESPDGSWQDAGSLPYPLAYGVSVTTEYGLFCIGGSDSQKAYKTVFVLEWVDGEIETTRLPDLPEACADAAGALLYNTIYIAGGQSRSAGSEVTTTLWKLELPSKKTQQTEWESLKWQALEPWPGQPRAQAVAAVQDGKFYLVSGFTLEPASNGKLKRKYINDGYCYHPKDGWHRIADVPRPVVAAPAINCGDSHIFVFGGYDDPKEHFTGKLKDKSQALSRDVLAYHTITDTWVKMDTMPVGLVLANAVLWQGQIVIPGGQTHPWSQSNQVYQAKLSPKKASIGALNIMVLTVYLLSLVAMGLYISRREKTTDDFFVGGRRIPWWAVGVSIFGTQLSSISFMAIPAKVYATNWLYFMGIVCIVLVQPIVVYFYLPFFRRLNITSAYEYLEKRFNVTVRLLGSLSFILFQLGRMTIVLFLPALALSVVTGINIYLCIVLMGMLATLYTVLGGIEAVVWTDLLQVIVLVGGALMALVIIVLSIDGGFSRVVEMGRAGGKFNWADLGWDYTKPVLWVIVVGGIFQNITSYSADQAVVQRYLTTKDERTAAGAIWAHAALVIPVSAIWFVLGTALYAFYKTRPQLLDPGLKTDQIFPFFIAQQLPDGIVGLVIAGLFAASMSTVDSSLNSISTAIITDFYRRFKTAANDRTCLHIARWLTLLSGMAATAAALWMATTQQMIKSLWDAYMAVLGLLMGSLAGLFALGVFTRRANGVSALIGAVGGAFILFLVQQYTRTYFYIYAAIGITGCFVIGYMASFIIAGEQKSCDGLTIYTLGQKDDQ